MCISNRIQQMNLIKSNLLNIEEKRCIGCLPDYTSGYYVYFWKYRDQPESHHSIFVLNQVPDMYITSPLNFLAETFVSLSK